MGKLWVPSTIILSIALILSILVSLSLPFLQFMDIARVSSPQEVFRSALKEMRFGIWAACSWTRDNAKECSPTSGTGYMVEIYALNPKNADVDVVRVTYAWTRGLVAHPFATGAILIALGASLSTKNAATLSAPLVTLWAAAMVLIAFAIQMALYLHVKVAIGGALDGANTSAGPAFWLTLVTLILVLLSGAIMFVNRRREMQVASGYPMLSQQNKGVKGLVNLFKRN